MKDTTPDAGSLRLVLTRPESCFVPGLLVNGSEMASVRLPAPECRIKIVRSSFLSPKSSHSKLLRSHPLNHAVDVFVTDIGSDRMKQLSAQLNTALGGKYHVLQAHPSSLITPQFIDLLRKGQFAAIERGAQLDRSNVVCVLPPGKLVLSLDKDTFEQFGLEGRKVLLSGVRRHVVEIDLLATAFVPGKKGYERVKWCLENRLSGAREFLVATDTDIESSGILPGDVSVQTVPLTTTTRDFEEVYVPVFNCLRDGSVAREADVAAVELFEWIGAVACGLTCAPVTADDFTSTFSVDSAVLAHNVVVSRGVSMRWAGIVLPGAVDRALSILREFVLTMPRDGVATLTAFGFADSPISFGDKKHGFDSNGDNLVCFALFPGGKYVSYAATNESDEHS